MGLKWEEAKHSLLFGDDRSAEKQFKTILRKDPGQAEAWHGLGLICFRKKDYNQGIQYLRKAVELAEAEPELWSSLGTLQLCAGTFNEAEESFDKAKTLYEKRSREEISSKYLGVLLKLSAIYIRQHRLNEAKSLLKAVLNQQPSHLGALKTLSQVYVALSQYYHAIQILERLPLDPPVLEASKVEIYLRKGDYRNALKCARKARELDPENPVYYYYLGECLIKARCLQESLDVFRQGLVRDPLHPKMLDRALSLQIKLCEWEGRDALLGALRQGFASTRSEEYFSGLEPTTAILAGCTNAELKEVAASRGRRIENSAIPLREKLQFQFSFYQNTAVEEGKVMQDFELESLTAGGDYSQPPVVSDDSSVDCVNSPPSTAICRFKKTPMLRIGYLSGDFHGHATMHLMEDLFGLHDRSRFEIYAYSYGKDDQSPLRKKIKEDCDAFVDFRQSTDEEAARKIHADRIHILVDLKGHIIDHRLGIVALRPAPLQMHYLGYPGTIGAPFIEYLIADRFVIPRSERKHYTESIVYLPDTYQVNARTKETADHGAKRADHGLPEEAFVFCCFNQNDKWDPGSLGAWMRILSAVPRSVLWAWGNYDGLKEKWERLADRCGIETGRLIVARTLPNPQHLARLPLGDLFLDTFLYNAHTSCSDALRMGLPVLTCPGKTFASRVAGSLLHHLGVKELIARSPEDYIERAIAFARSPMALKKVRDKIVKNRDSTHLFNPKAFTRHLENAYEVVWASWQSGESPRDVIL